jgi:15-cis-phytoene synthase
MDLIKPRTSNTSIKLSEDNLEKIIQQHSKSFYFASSFLPKEKRLAIWSLYAFCRATDDLVDENPHSNIQEITDWQAQLNNTQPSPNPIIQTFRETIAKFNIPIQYANDLIEGCKSDLTKNRYKNFDELSHYCYQVASTVGLMSCYIIGFNKSHQELVLNQAHKAGIALQLTNIIRDIKEDLTLNRVYLPQEDFEQFNCDYFDPSSWKASNKFKALVKFQIERAQKLYKDSQSGIQHLSVDGRFAINSALTVYEGILTVIQKRNYDVFGQRAYLNLGQKLSKLPQILIKSFQ